MKSKLSIVLWALLCMGFFSTTIWAEDEYSRLYKLQPGDTPEQVAEKELGDASLADVLLKFNRLERRNFGSRTNQFIALPKGAIEQTSKTMAQAEKVIEQARMGQAAKYAAIELKEAEFLMKMASSAQNTGGFNKARQQATLAMHRAIEALSLSNERAMKPSALQLDVASYSVKVDVDDSVDDLLALNVPVAGVTKVSTSSGRALLRLGASTKILMHADTSIVLEAFRYDERTNVETLRLRLERGRFEWERLASKPTASTFEVSIAHDVLQIHSSAGLLAQLDSGVVSLNVFDGHTSLADGVNVAAGSGQVWRGGRAEGVAALPVTPVIDDSEKGMTFASQTPTLAWPIETSAEGLIEVVAGGTEGAFVSLLQEHTVSGEASALNVLSAGKYFVRLIGHSSEGLFSPPSSPLPLNISLELGVTIQTTPAALKTSSNLVVSANHLIQATSGKGDTSVVFIEYQVDDAPYKPVEDGFILFEPGLRTLRIRGVSVEGERGGVVEQRFLVDKQAPDIQFIVQTGMDVDSGLEQTLLSLEARDDHGLQSIEFKLNDGEFSPYERVMKLRVDEKTTFTFRATDKVGNVSRPRSMLILP